MTIMVFAILNGYGTFSSKASRLKVQVSSTKVLYFKQVQRGRRLLVHCVLKYVIVHLADGRGTRMKINIFEYFTLLLKYFETDFFGI